MFSTIVGDAADSPVTPARSVHQHQQDRVAVGRRGLRSAARSPRPRRTSMPLTQSKYALLPGRNHPHHLPEVPRSSLNTVFLLFHILSLCDDNLHFIFKISAPIIPSRFHWIIIFKNSQSKYGIEVLIIILQKQSSCF